VTTRATGAAIDPTQQWSHDRRSPFLIRSTASRCGSCVATIVPHLILGRDACVGRNHRRDACATSAGRDKANHRRSTNIAPSSAPPNPATHTEKSHQRRHAGEHDRMNRRRCHPRRDQRAADPAHRSPAACAGPSPPRADRDNASSRRSNNGCRSPKDTAITAVSGVTLRLHSAKTPKAPQDPHRHRSERDREQSQRPAKRQHEQAREARESSRDASDRSCRIERSLCAAIGAPSIPASRCRIGPLRRGGISQL